MNKLNNGNTIPSLCYGSAIVETYKYSSSGIKSAFKYWTRNIIKDRNQLKKDIALPKAVQYCMDNGCNMFDTSRAYAGSEYSIGKILSKYKRDSYYIVTKLCNRDQYNGNIRGALQRSLKELNVSYVDLYLMHWPVEGEYIKSWLQMEQLYKEGLCKAIGVCNCNVHHLEEIEKKAEIMPMVNQFECHPLFTQKELRDYCKKKNIQVMAYTSTARMDERLKKTVLVPIAKKYNKSIAQIILRWHQQVNNIPIVNSSNLEHLAENISIYDFNLTNEEIEKIESININSRLRYDPDNCDFTQL